MSAIVTALIPLLFKLIGWLFDRSKMSDKQKEAFKRYYKAYEEMENESVKQADEVDKQLKELKNKNNSK